MKNKTFIQQRITFWKDNGQSSICLSAHFYGEYQFLIMQFLSPRKLFKLLGFTINDSLTFLKAINIPSVLTI